MPISEKRKVYLFNKCHERRLKSILQNRSLAISFWSAKNRKPIVINRTEKIIKIIICKSLLPRHCDGKLVEQALDLLQKYPEDNELLKIVSDYTKNDLFECIGYWGVLIVGTMGFCCSGGVLYLAIVVYPLMLHPYLGVFSICMVVTATTFFISNMFYDHALGLKFGRWVGELIEGTHQKSVNLEELKRALMIHIQGGKIAPTEDTHLKTIGLEALKRKLMARIWNDEIGEAIEEAVEAFINEKSDIESAEDIHPITINLEELKITLLTRIPSDEVEKAIKAIEETIEEFFNEDRRVESIQEGNILVRQYLDHFWATGSTMPDTKIKTFCKYQQCF